MTALFRFLGTLVSLYCLACFVRLILTWFPGAAYSAFGRFLSRICDPYLNFFRRFRFLRTSQLDFSPVLALAVLGGAGTILAQIAASQRVSVGYILASIIQVLWSVAASLIFFLLIFIAIRLISLIAAPNSRSEFFLGLDRILYPVMRPFSGVFGKNPSWIRQLLLGGLCILAARILAGSLVGLIMRLCISLPF
jgi:YggT family protein